MPALQTCLWFRSEAEEAARHYVAIFPNSKVGQVLRAGGGVVAVEFVLDGAPFLALNGRLETAFTDACSILVPCDTQEEIDRYWGALVQGGAEGQCGWLTDRFGVSWQVAPRDFASLLSHPDPVRARRAMQAMMGMRKIDVAAIREARDGELAAAGAADATSP
ncbi:VOC family protein [Roseisolibacter agri]|uniref:3-demethylubiquinone-9 3-methyltransferase n=1 Tax=Roseisolibacter agri TaxID=2014610 RepID=A0AA37QAV9_9BACT|nr:VOC family protein [Roseisolibacter agri]GLC26927.1 putative 3-demethylubiquinone-9 3-methyltransferase [Roseisolibacter agri]